MPWRRQLPSKLWKWNFTSEIHFRTQLATLILRLCIRKSALLRFTWITIVPILCCFYVKMRLKGRSFIVLCKIVKPFFREFFYSFEITAIYAVRFLIAVFMRAFAPPVLQIRTACFLRSETLQTLCAHRPVRDGRNIVGFECGEASKNTSYTA